MMKARALHGRICGIHCRDIESYFESITLVWEGGKFAGSWAFGGGKSFGPRHGGDEDGGITSQ